MKSSSTCIRKILEEFVGKLEAGIEPQLHELVSRLKAEEQMPFVQMVKKYLDIKSREGFEFQDLVDKAGEFRILGEIARGGTSQVSLAIDARNQLVAIKVYPESISPASEGMRRLEREYRILQSISHPNIVQVLDFGLLNGKPFYSMKLLTGGTLQDRIQEQITRSGKAAGLPPLKLTHSISQIARAAQATHTSGVVHRDIKPMNIMFDSKDNAYLGDFGLAHLQAEAPITTSESVFGSLAYMAPERLSGNSVKLVAQPSEDIFALGVTLFQALTGKLPFPGHFPELLRQIQQGPPALFGDLCPAVIPSFQRILDKSLQADPNDRYASMEMFAIDLEAISNEN